MDVMEILDSSRRRLVVEQAADRREPRNSRRAGNIVRWGRESGGTGSGARVPAVRRQVVEDERQRVQRQDGRTETKLRPGHRKTSIPSCLRDWCEGSGVLENSGRFHARVTRMRKLHNTDDRVRFYHRRYSHPISCLQEQWKRHGMSILAQ